jgi:hypothetical protein
MHLELPHSTCAIRDNSDNRVWHITKPSGAEEWQNPEWSTHDNYCTATAKHGDGYNVYVIRISDKELYKVIDGNNAVPHLWVGEPSAGTPQANTPSIAPNGGEVTGPSVRVTLATSTEGASIHYTTDGSVPTESSAPYTQPFDLNVPSGASVTLKAKAFKTGMDPSEAASATFTRVSYRSPDNPAIDLTAGVEYAYYEGSWDMLPSFTDLTPLVRGTAAGFDLGLTQRNDHFAVRYTGYIDISAEGTYTFSSTSDDGSAVYIGSRMVVDNDGTHAAEEQSGTIALGAGKHEIVVAFFEAEGGEELTVRYQGPGITRQPIPESALYRRVPPVTVTAPNGNETFTVGSTAHITWETDSRVADVAIKISPDGGKSWADITSDGSVDKGSDEWKNFSWTVPGRLDGMSLVSDNCLISIEEYNVPANNDRSDAQFAIVPASAAHPRGVGRRNHRVLVRWDGGAVAVPRSSEILLFSLDGTVRTRLRLGGRPGARLPHELPAGAYLLVQAASADRAVAPRRILLIR